MGKLVWIASYPKSGNTWVRAFLHNYIRQPAAPYDINRLTDLTASDVSAERYARYDARPASQYSVADVQRMRPLVQRDLMALDPTLVFVKTHNALMAVAGAPLIAPEVTAGGRSTTRSRSWRTRRRRPAAPTARYTNGSVPGRCTWSPGRRGRTRGCT